MSMFKRMVQRSVAVLVALGVASTVTAGVVYTDDMEAYSASCDAPIGDWKWRELQYSDANCATFSGVEPGYDKGPNQLKDLFACTYYNVAGVVPAGDNNAITGKSLAIADNAEGNATACHRIQAAVELTTDSSSPTALGEGEKVIYTFTAKVRSNQYGDNTADSETGILLTILDINDNYSAITEKKVAVDPASGDVSEKFEVNLTGKTNILVQAGFYAQANGDGQSQAQWDDLSLSWEKDEGEAEEIAACADTSVLRFEDAFGDAKITCKTDTYEFPSSSPDWAGFGDTKRGDHYPFYFAGDGAINVDCSTQSGTAKVYFKFQEKADAAGIDVGQEKSTDKVTCGASSSRASQSITLPASDFGGFSWGNLLLYIDGADRDVPVQVKDITVTGSGPVPTTPEMVPAVPLWGLFGLTSLVALLGLRRRRK